MNSTCHKKYLRTDIGHYYFFSIFVSKKLTNRPFVNNLISTLDSTAATI